MRRHCRRGPHLVPWVVPASCPTHTTHTDTRMACRGAWHLALLTRPGMEVLVGPTQTGTWLVRSCISGLSATSRRTYSKFTVTAAHGVLASTDVRIGRSQTVKRQATPAQPSPAWPPPPPGRHRGHAHLITPRAPTQKKKKSQKLAQPPILGCPLGFRTRLQTPVQSDHSTLGGPFGICLRV